MFQLRVSTAAFCVAVCRQLWDPAVWVNMAFFQQQNNRWVAATQHAAHKLLVRPPVSKHLNIKTKQELPPVFSLHTFD
jgi:hypothetical protein